MAGWLTNGLTLIAGGTSNANLGGREQLPVDTEATAGSPPQTLAATTFNVAALASGLIHNTASATSGAATLNTRSGLITTDSVTTAVGSTYTLTLTNSAVTAAVTPQVFLDNGTNTTTGAAVTSITPSAGSLVVVITNNGTAALNGTLLVAFRI